jgi:hypothetical protein
VGPDQGPVSTLRGDRIPENWTILTWAFPFPS